MRRAAVPLLVACVLLAGCDGGLHIAGQVVRPDGRPVADAMVRIHVGERSAAPDQEERTDAEGRFGVNRLDCPCEFPVTIEAAHPELGRARFETTHRALERDPKVRLTLEREHAP